jgi:type VI protein secretion system component Hcp
MEGNTKSEPVYPTEVIGLTYDHIEWNYDKQDETGKSTGKVATKFSLAKVTAA